MAYTQKINFDAPKVVKDALERYAKGEGVKSSVIARKALVKYLKDKNALDMDKNYL